MWWPKFWVSPIDSGQTFLIFQIQRTGKTAPPIGALRVGHKKQLKKFCECRQLLTGAEEKRLKSDSIACTEGTYSN